MKTYRCAIVGCTGRGRMHALAYQHIHRAKLVACADHSEENRSKFSGEFSVTGYVDAEEMIRKEKPDLVHLVTSPHTRVEQMTMLDKMGVPACIVEKPIALEVRDWSALNDLAMRAQTRFGVGAQFRYHPDMLRCQAAVRSGNLGTIRFLDASAVGTICDQGVHVLDWAMSLNNDAPAVRVFGVACGDVNMNHPVHPSPDTTVAQLVFANGVHGLWNLGASAPRVLADETYYKHCRVAAYTEFGHTLYEEFGRWEILDHGHHEHGHVDERGWREGNHLAQANLTNAMFDWLEDDTRPVGTHLTRALEQWNVILGLYASTLWLKPVTIPFDPPEDLWVQLSLRLSGER